MVTFTIMLYSQQFHNVMPAGRVDRWMDRNSQGDRILLRRTDHFPKESWLGGKDATCFTELVAACPRGCLARRECHLPGDTNGKERQANGAASANPEISLQAANLC